MIDRVKESANQASVNAKLNQLDEKMLVTAREEYLRDGATIIRGVIPPEWLKLLAEATERLMGSPEGAGRNYSREGEGRFFGDIFAYLRMPEYKDFILSSGVGELVAGIMDSSTVRFFYDQPLVKEPGSSLRTPWHQDSAYWPCTGQQVVSVWLPLDSATSENGVLSYVKGSHKWNSYHPMEEWSQSEDIDNRDQIVEDLPQEDPGPGATKKQVRTISDINEHPENYEFVSWSVEPGDILLHQMDTIHGANGNLTQNMRRRAIALRFFGDDARWNEAKPHFMRYLKKDVPEFPYPKHETGDLITDPLFPIVWQA